MRLIDADAMNEELFYEQTGGKDTLITCEAAFDMIKAQPTVYDIDRVVDELDMARTNNNGLKFEFIPFDKVAEIVKNCCVSNDVCEWRKHSICGFYSEHEGAVRIINIADGFKYCPYCGKKIKVVE